MPDHGENRAIEQTFSNLADWFWSIRPSRFPQPEAGHDLCDAIYSGATAWRAVSQRSAVARPACGLWGPSQAGKSTLVGEPIDRGAAADGTGSALHWPGGAPARFSPVENTPAVILNPYNSGLDGTMCASRFVSKDHIRYPRHPVLLRFAGEEEMRLALALGYLYECRLLNEDKLDISWDLDGVERQLARLTAGRSAGAPQRAAFELLHHLCTHLECLVRCGHHRYNNLAESLPRVRRLLLTHPVLLAHPDAARQCVHRLLWDEHAPLADLLREVMRFREARPWLRDGEVWCSLELASALLDASSFQHVIKPAPTASGIVWADLPRRIRYRTEGSSILIGLDEGAELCPMPRDFGLLQALVWEMEIPLRRDVLTAQSPAFARLLDAADVLDLPGVARKDKDVKAIDLTLPEMASDSELVTKVLKRGKTASLVYRYAEGLAVDSFTVLSVTNSPPSKPEQLAAGIKAWLGALQADYQPESGKRAPLPLNLALTQGSNLINEVILNGTRKGLQATFRDMVQSLGWLAQPEVLHHTFLLNHHRFFPFIVKATGQTLRPGDVQVVEAKREVAEDLEFKARFQSDASASSLTRMCEDVDGGSDHLFSVLARDAATSGGIRNELAKVRQRSILTTVQAAISAHLPSTDTAARVRDFQSFGEAIKNSIMGATAEQSLRISSALRRFATVDPGMLEEIPVRAAMMAPQTREAYAQRALDLWVAAQRRELDRGRLVSFADDLGLADAALPKRMVEHLRRSVSEPELSNWIGAKVGYLQSLEDRMHARRYLALWIASKISGRASGQGHADLALVQNRLTAYDATQWQVFQPESSPEWLVVGEPFVRHLEFLCQQNIRIAPPKAGDEQLRALLTQGLAAAQQLGL